MVAEGIEEPAELGALQDLDEPCGPGFLRGRPARDPMPIPWSEEWAAAEQRGA